MCEALSKCVILSSSPLSKHLWWMFVAKERDKSREPSRSKNCVQGVSAHKCLFFSDPLLQPNGGVVSTPHAVPLCGGVEGSLLLET